MKRAFRDLEIWKKGYSLLMKIYELSSNFPQEEKYNLTSQIRRSANSVIASITESHGRYYYADKTRVLYIGRGECEETQSHLSVALGRKYISESEFCDLDREYERLDRGINSYIFSITKRKELD